MTAGRLKVTVLGSGDAFGSGGRFQACFAVEPPAIGGAAGGGRFLVDCGASSLIAMKRHGIATGDVAMVLVTHLHGDHFGGLPFFLLDAEHVDKRTAALTIAGPPGLEARLQEAREVLYPGTTDGPLPFPLRLVEMPAAVPTGLPGGVSVTPEVVDHPSGAPSYGLRIEVAGRVLAFSGDTAWTPALPRLAAGADLFVCECAGFAEPVPHHVSHTELVAHRDELDCRRLVLVHLGAAALGHLGEIGPEVAEDGMVIEL